MRARPIEPAIEQAFPGLLCLYVEDWPEWEETVVCVTGSAEDLVRHQLVTQQMLDLLPPCGYRGYRKHAQKTLALPFMADVYRKPKGFRISRRYLHDDRRALLQRLGPLAGLRESAPPHDRLPRHLRLIWSNPAVM